MSANGIVLYHGPSLITGAPIVAIMTGVAAGSSNVKTGDMVQTYMLHADLPPVTAARLGADTSVCGNCPHRSVASGGAGSCYVNLGWGPRAVWDCWKYGSGYATGSVSAAAFLLFNSGRALRIGTYGDPAAVPVSIWRELLPAARAHAGYTHQWRGIGAGLKGIVQASVDSQDEAIEARAAGWATFRVAPVGVGVRMRGEARCPASAEAGKKVTCEGCPIKCDGALYGGIWGRVAQAHGSTKLRVCAIAQGPTVN